MRILKYLGLGFVGLVLVIGVAAGIFIATLDIDQHKDRIAAEVEKATGRKLVFGGPLKLQIFPRIELSVAELRFANMATGSRPDMATVKRAELAVDLKALIDGHLKIERLVLDGADVLLETDKAGLANWDIAPKGDPADKDKAGSGGMPDLQVGKLEVRNVVLAYRDGKSGQVTRVAISKLELAAPDPAGPIALALEAVVDKVKYALDGTVGPLGVLLGAKEPWPVALKAKAADVRLAVEGKIAKPLEGAGFDLKVTAIADDTKAFGVFAATDIPSLGPFQLAARVADADGGYRISDIALAVGPNDVAGEVLIKTAPRIYLNAKLKTKSLDLDRLGDAVAKKPAGQTVPAPAPAPKPADGRVIPDTPVALDAIPTDLDVFLTYGIDALKAGGIAWKGVALDLTLAGGKTTIRKAEIGYRDGKVSLRGEVDGRARPAPTLLVRGGSEKLDIGALLKELQVTDLMEGRLESEIELKASGKTVRQIAASLDGRIGGVVGDGKIASKYLDFIAADLIGSLVGAAFGKEDSTKLNCVVLRTTFDKGAGKLDGLLLDTQKIAVVGTGTAHLGTEALDLRFVPQPKDAALISLAVPIEIKGTMAAPSIGTDKASVAKAVGGVALTTVFGPLALLMPLAKTGVEDKTPCVKAIQETGVGQKRPAAPAAQPQPRSQQKR